MDRELLAQLEHVVRQLDAGRLGEEPLGLGLERHADVGLNNTTIRVSHEPAAARLRSRRGRGQNRHDAPFIHERQRAANRRCTHTQPSGAALRCGVLSGAGVLAELAQVEWQSNESGGGPGRRSSLRGGRHRFCELCGLAEA